MKKILIVMLMLLGLSAGAEAKGVVKPRGYIFGLSASFRDSVIYFTDIQTIDSVWVESKNDLLLSRENYSAQMKAYIDQVAGTGRTNIVVFSTKRKTLEKKYVKLKKRYTQGKRHYDVRFIPNDDFHFKSIDLHVEYGEAPTQK